jgi:hypothetical protein
MLDQRASRRFATSFVFAALAGAVLQGIGLSITQFLLALPGEPSSVSIRDCSFENTCIIL